MTEQEMESWVKRYELLRRTLNMQDAIGKLAEEIEEKVRLEFQANQGNLDNNG